MKMYIFYDSKNILPPVGTKLTGTLRLLLNAKNGKEIANVGIKDSKNAISKAVFGVKAEVFTLLLFAVSTKDDDEEDIDGNDATEDEEDDTNRNLSSSEVVMALGLVRTVPPLELMIES